MSDPTPPPGQPLQPTDPAVPQAATPAVEAKPKKRRWRRWAIRILIALPILLIVLVLLAPTLLSLGPVRSAILPMVSSRVAPHGKLDIRDWTFSWFGGQRIEGITLLDDRNAEVAHLNVKTDASLWKLIRGNYAVGDTQVAGDFDIRIDPATGRINAMHILGLDDAPAKVDPSKPQPTQPNPTPAPQQPAPTAQDDKLPIDLSKVSGTVTLNLNGTISSTDPADKTIPFTKLEKGNFVADLNNLETGTKVTGDVAMTVGGKPATLTLNAFADLIEKNQLITDPQQIVANATGKLTGLDLSIVNAFLAKQDITVAGNAAGDFIADVKPGAPAVIKTQDFGLSNVAVTAPQLKRDTLKLARVDLPLNITRSADADPIIKIEAAGVKTDLGGVAITGSLPESILTNLAANKAPGGQGQVVVTTDVPEFARIVAMFPNVVKLPEGTAVTRGGLNNVITLSIKPDAASVAQNLKLQVEGTANGKPIQIQPITLDSSADVALRDGLAVAITDVTGFKLDLASSFANVHGGGVPTKASIKGDANLDTLQSELAQFVDLKDLSLKGSLDFGLDTNGDPTDAAKPLGVKATANVKNTTIAQAQTAYLNNENITADVDLALARPADKQVLTFNTLAVHSDSGLFDLEKVGDTAWFATFTKGGFAGVFEFKFGAALDRLAAPFLATVDPAYRLNRARAAGTLAMAIDQGTGAYKVNVNTTVNRIAVGNAINDETITVTADAQLPQDVSTAVANFTVASGFVTLGGNADVRLSDPARPEVKLSPFEMARAAKFNGTVPDLKKLYTLAKAFGLVPPETKADEAGNSLPPLNVDGGSLAFDGSVTRDEKRNVTAVVFNVPGLKDLAVSRGDQKYRQAEPITVTLAADITADTSKATVTEQLQRVAVSKLAADLPGLATLKMGEPIELTIASDGKTNLKGQINGDADLGTAGSLLKVVQGKDPIGYSGWITYEERLTSSNGMMTAVGKATADRLASNVPGAQPLPEKLRTIEVTNDVAIDSAFTTLTVNKVEAGAPQARDVFHATVVGTVRQLMTQNVLDGVKATLAYDAGQAWPLLQPIVDPTGESIGKADVAGKYEKTFVVSGSYPMVDAAGRPLLFNEAIKSVLLNGDVQLDRFNAKEKGVDVSNLKVALALRNGVATVGGGAFDVNEGKGNLSGISVDLTKPEPVLGDVKDHQLVKGAKINPVVANSLGKYINPIFPKATTATGVLDLALSSKNLKLGPALLTEKSGAATVVLSIMDMEIGNPLTQDMVGGLVNKVAGAFGRGGMNTEGMENFRGYIKDGKLQLNNGIVTQNITLMIGDAPRGADATAANTGGKDAAANAKPAMYPLSFTGDVRLSDLNMNLDAGVPIGWVLDKVRTKDQNVAQILQALPDQVKFGLSGTTTNAKPTIDPKFVQAVVQAVAQQQLGNLINGNKKGDDKNDAANDGKGGGGGLLGQLEGALRNKDDRKDADKTDPNKNDNNKNDSSDDDKKKSQAQKRREAEEQQRQEEQRKKDADAKKKPNNDNRKSGSSNDDPKRDDTPRNR